MTTQNMYTSGWMVLILIISISISTSSGRDIDKYTEDKVKTDFAHVMKYSRQDMGGGIIRIRYYEIPGKHLHWFSVITFGLVSVGVGIADAVIAANPPWRNFYFKEDTGELLSTDYEKARQILADREQAAREAREQAARDEAARVEAARVEAAKEQAARDKAALDEAVKKTVREALVELRNLVERLRQQGKDHVGDGQDIVKDPEADVADREEANRHFNDALRLFEETTRTQESLKQLIEASKRNGNIDIVNRAIRVLVKYYGGTQHAGDTTNPGADPVPSRDAESNQDVVIQPQS